MTITFKDIIYIVISGDYETTIEAAFTKKIDAEQYMADRISMWGNDHLAIDEVPLNRPFRVELEERNAEIVEQERRIAFLKPYEYIRQARLTPLSGINLIRRAPDYLSEQAQSSRSIAYNNPFRVGDRDMITNDLVSECARIYEQLVDLKVPEQLAMDVIKTIVYSLKGQRTGKSTALANLVRMVKNEMTDLPGKFYKRDDWLNMVESAVPDAMRQRHPDYGKPTSFGFGDVWARDIPMVDLEDKE